MSLVKYANDNFDDVIVMLNTANAIEMGWSDSQYFPNIKACMWVGYPGQEGITSIAKALTGEVNPSGRLVDTYAYDAMSAPATQIFEYGEWTNTNNEENGPKNAYTVYGESIYIGYRYYETRYEDTVLGQGNASTADSEYDYTKQVQYPFGYGISYTQFDYSDFSLTENGDNFTAQVTVTNSGDVAGKDVVEVYFQSPYTDYDRENLVEKIRTAIPDISLTTDIIVGFPGETEAQYQNLLQFLEEMQLDCVGAFPYSREEGTAADLMEGHLEEDEKTKKRAENFNGIAV